MQVLKSSAPLKPERSLPKAEHAIVVLGTKALADGTPTPDLLTRLKRALREAKKDPNAVLVVSGASVHTAMPEARAMKNWLVKHGVAEGRIVMEPKARLTIENAEFVAPMLKAMGVKRVTLDTARYHMPRSMVLMRSALKAHGLSNVELRAAPAPDGLSLLASIKKAFQEGQALVRDAVNQRQMHRGLPLALVPAQVTQINHWDHPPEGYIDWGALIGHSQGEHGLVTHVSWL